MTRRAQVRGGLVALLALSTALAGCAPDVDRADFDAVRLQTTASSQLYFKNVRSVFYAQRDHAPSGATLYRLKDRPSDTAPDLDAVIANDVLRDRAFVELQPNAAWSALAAVSLSWRDPDGSARGSFKWQTDHPARTFRTAGQLLRNLEKDHALWAVDAEGHETAVLTDDAARRRLRRALRDFFELVDVL